MSLDLYVTAALLCAIIGHFVYARWTNSLRGLPSLPGPRRLPFLGNAHQISIQYPEKTFAGWAKTYGDVVHVHLLHRSILVLNSLDAAQDFAGQTSVEIFRQANVLPRSVMAFLPYNEKYRKLRRWFQVSLENKAVLSSYYPMQRKHINRLLLDLIESPDDFISHIKRYTGSLTLEMTYGYFIPAERDDFMEFADAAMFRLNALGSLSATLVDFFPILQYIPAWMPGGGYKREALGVKEVLDEMMDRPYRRACETIAAGKATPSFTTFITEQISQDGQLTEQDESDIKSSAFTMYGAGYDTTMITLLSFLLAMVLHPEVFQKAQAEIDRVICTSRLLLELSDRDALPYIECVIKETYRWNPPLPLGLPHHIRDEDSYRDGKVPGETTVMPNIWAMTRDLSMYPDPEDFKPERFYVMDESTADLRDPRKAVFGFGRRICPGRYLADANVWLAVANIIACMNIRKARDSLGEEITPVPSFTSGLSSRVNPFAGEIRPRRKDIIDLIKQVNAYDTT